MPGASGGGGWPGCPAKHSERPAAGPSSDVVVVTCGSVQPFGVHSVCEDAARGRANSGRGKVIVETGGADFAQAATEDAPVGHTHCLRH